MSQGYDEDDFEYELEELPPPKKKTGAEALRAAYEKEKARRVELEAAVAKVQKDLASRTVRDVLTAQGADPRLARYVLADIEDVSDDNVTKWLDENGDLFGYAKQSDGDHAEEAQARTRAAQAGGQSVVPDGDSLARIQSAGSIEELQALAKQVGIS